MQVLQYLKRRAVKTPGIVLQRFVFSPGSPSGLTRILYANSQICRVVPRGPWLESRSFIVPLGDQEHLIRLADWRQNQHMVQVLAAFHSLISFINFKVVGPTMTI